MLSFNDAVNATMRLLKELGVEEETLVIVTSDHSHTLTISGYPERGNNILGEDQYFTLMMVLYPYKDGSLINLIFPNHVFAGIAAKSKADGVPYTTLTYANSWKDNYHYSVNGTSVVRQDPSTVDTTSFEYGVQAAVFQDENTHGGSDVFVYATGKHNSGPDKQNMVSLKLLLSILPKNSMKTLSCTSWIS